MNDSTPQISDKSKTTEPQIIEYLLVTDTTSKIVFHSLNYNEIVRMAGLIRRAGGQVTIFKSLKT